VDVLTISELMGHSSADMTRRYLGLNISDMRTAIAKYDTKSELVIIEEVPQRRIAPLISGFGMSSYSGDQADESAKSQDAEE